MILFIEEENVTVPINWDSFNFTAEASSLGWVCGLFPKVLETTLGNKENFVLVELTEEEANYTQQYGVATLTVFND